jgi:pancreatic triacylglycerol lipase
MELRDAFAVLSFVLLANGILASPVPRRWELVPDAGGRMHLVDLDPLEIPVEPSFVPHEDIVFLLFTRSNPTAGQVLTLGDAGSVLTSNFNPGHETRLTIHGWNGAPSNPVNVNSNAAYFQHGDYNMITVDWRVGSGTPNYITGRNRVPLAAEAVADFVDFLHLHGFIDFHRTHVIGHSLGGQMAGIVGKLVDRGTIQVIYALDPAGPLFNLADINGRVAPGDGVYVEVMHTNGGVLGFLEPIGDADFFPAGGRSQPGCGVDIGGGCAHGRTAFYYAESINTAFTSTQCAGGWPEIDNGQCTPTGVTASMGGAFGNIGLRGDFWLPINEQSPFSQG